MEAAVADAVAAAAAAAAVAWKVQGGRSSWVCEKVHSILQLQRTKTTMMMMMSADERWLSWWRIQIPRWAP